ncbi:PIG-M-domain-containing protein [Protomyces lactucae-debilis]|uniref:Bifunctional lycopene cyclase/phytoene synthase n=1 Tax=Protomyces lactucae-debilis TaxID=2754530 RepID=A0A1Y2FT05_PROLT|nr:PIG-M-domain-containing protein [Protomyces lactucae-debilis]ORY86316.1 PIG-M-domain-containing protein [Protomyces lactucae-debilis]
MLTYLQVHVYYNVPPLILLFLLHRPLATSRDWRKYLFLCVIAVLYTTPWDNWIIYNKAWTYCPSCVMGTLGLVPVEEYLFFVVQTLLTCQLHSLLTKTMAGLPAVSISPNKKAPLLSTSLAVAWLAMGAAAISYADPSRKTFYLAAIIAWTAPVLCFLFTISAIQTSFLQKRWAPSLLAIALPTLYLCIIDSIAIRAGTWHITERTSLEIFLWKGLPIEEAIFFFVTNLMVVLGCTGFDLASAIVSTYDKTETFSFLSLCYALLCPRNENVVRDLRACVEILQAGSASFYNSSFFFDEDIRRDLVVLYAFCRFTDDVADDASEPLEKRKAKLDETRVFIQTEFPTRLMLPMALPKSEKAICLYDHPVYRTMLRYIANKLPQEPLLELLDGYEWDLLLDTDRSKQMQSEEDVIRYSSFVASSVAEMCICLLDKSASADVLKSARKMGVVLQLTNIARDILTDAINGRVYLPQAWLTEEDRKMLLHVAKDHDITSIEEDPRIMALHLERYALRLLSLADEMYAESTGKIDALPEQVQRGLRIVTDGYYAIGRQLRSTCNHGRYPRRAKLSKWNRLLITFKHLYCPTEGEALILGGCLLRFVLLLYGAWQDSLGVSVTFTDIDYKVFSDAAHFVQQGGSPYERATYRYTPLLAWLLIPNDYFEPFGKCLFAAGDILTGWLIIRLLRRRQQNIRFAAIWLLNPMVAVISTRGNCEALLGAMAVGLLYAVEVGQIALAGVILGAAVHFKVYPILYAPAVVWHLETPGHSTSLLSFINRKRVTFAFWSALTFLALSASMFSMYGWPFVEHTFAYHVSRSDHRHNFSVYHLFIYLTAQQPKSAGIPWTLLAFLPQLVLSLVVLPLRFSKRHLTGTFMAQTFCFVAFNKVVTSQYFMWYLVFLPLTLPGSQLLSWRKGGVMLFSWIAAQACWLGAAFQFEMQGKATFEAMAISSGVFFLVNMWILGEMCKEMA